MNTLLATAAAIALTSGAVSGAPRANVRDPEISPVIYQPGGLKLLYSQNSNPDGYAILSQNFSRTDSPYDCAAADDFVVPTGHRWKIAEVDVTGLYFTGSGAGTGNVTFYQDSDGNPGKIVRFLPDQSYRDDNGSLSITLGSKVRLKAGIYWISVVSNGPSWDEWGWDENATIRGRPAMWENPNGGFGACPNWGTIGNCLGYTGDLMFDLKGKD